MENLFLCLIQAIIYIETVGIITSFFLYHKGYVEYRKIKLFIIYVPFVIMMYLNCDIVIQSFLQLIILYILLDFLFSGSKLDKLILVITEMGSISNIYQMLKSIVVTFESIIKIEINNLFLEVLIGAFIYLILSIIIKRMKGKYIHTEGKIGIKYALFFMVLVVVQGVLITSMGELVFQEIVMARKLAFEIAYIMVIVFMFIQIGLMIALIISRNVYREKEDLAARYLEEQKVHYEYLKDRERETKKFRHDIRNHILIVNDLINKKKYDECESYLQDIKCRIDKFSYKITVNNEIADAIINKFLIEARQKGIELSVKGHLPNPCNLSAVDLCTILSNLLSNAVEAEVEAGGNQIKIEFRYTDTEIMVAIENDYKHDLKQENGAFFTTKNDSLNHGFGLENVKECVKANHGQITIDTKNCLFKVLVCMNNGDGKNENCNR